MTAARWSDLMWSGGEGKGVDLGVVWSCIGEAVIHGFLVLEAAPLLLASDVGNDIVDLASREPFNGRHIAEVPVVLGRTVGDGRSERVVAVVPGFVHDREVGGCLLYTSDAADE